MFLVSGFLHYNLSSVISSLCVTPRFLFYRNECRTTLVFPSCQIKKLLSDYIERKQYSLKCVILYVFAVCGHSFAGYILILLLETRIAPSFSLHALQAT